jgi:polar amino acid transport system substrate-binding protein
VTPARGRIARRRAIALIGTGIAGAIGGCALRYASTLKQIRSTGDLRVGLANGAPWFELDPVSGEWRGVGVGFGRRLAQDLGVRFVPVETSWSQAVAGLQANQYDIMPVLDPTPQRRKAIDFPAASMFHYAMGAIAAVPGLTHWSQFDTPGMKIGVALGTAGDSFAAARAPRARTLRFTSIEEAISAFVARRVDAVIFYFPALVSQHAKIRQGHLVLPDPVRPVSTSAGIRHDPDGAWSRWLSERFASYQREGVSLALFRDYARQFASDEAAADALARKMMGIT